MLGRDIALLLKIKIHRFSHRDEHVLFLEPEWVNSDQIYLNGFSTSLPEAVQLMALRTIPGLGTVRFFRPGYAIEYDFFSPSQLKSSLESKEITWPVFRRTNKWYVWLRRGGGTGPCCWYQRHSICEQRGPPLFSLETRRISAFSLMI